MLAAWRAQVEGPAFQSSGPEVVLGGGGFADDSAPPDALVQLGADGPLAAGLRAARAGSGRVQGRNSTVPLSHPVEVPHGDWALTLQTSWLEPAYVEPDASWSRPGDSPASPLANGGAFGGKRHSPVPAEARELADATGAAVRVLWRREDVVRRGPKRPPLADRAPCRRDRHRPRRAHRAFGWSRTTGGPCAGMLPRRGGRDGRRGRTAGVVRPARRGLGRGARGAGRAPAPPPPPTALRASGEARVGVPGAGTASVELQVADGSRGRVEVDVWAGEILCPVTLRSYALGAVHQALGMVWSEGIALDDGR